MAVRPVSDGGSRASASPAYERVPPHNVEAEESVGTHRLTVRLHPEVEATVNLEVVPG